MRWRNLCHQLDGRCLKETSCYGRSCARPNSYWGDLGWGSRTHHRRLRCCFGTARLAGSTTIRVWRIVYRPSTSSPSLPVALGDLERNSNRTDGVMSRRTPNACGEEGADHSQKISFEVRLSTIPILSNCSTPPYVHGLGLNVRQTLDWASHQKNEGQFDGQGSHQGNGRAGQRRGE